MSNFRKYGARVLDVLPLLHSNCCIYWGYKEAKQKEGKVIFIKMTSSENKISYCCYESIITCQQGCQKCPDDAL